MLSNFLNVKNNDELIIELIIHLIFQSKCAWIAQMVAYEWLGTQTSIRDSVAIRVNVQFVVENMRKVY